MSTPVGHTIVGIALAKRLRLRSPSGLVAALLLTNLPDLDILASVLLRGDPWALHRGASHSLKFAVVAGGSAGVAGLIRTEGHTAHRELFRDAFSGMLIVGSHVMLDRAPYRPIRVGPRFLGMRLANWLLDAAQCAVVAWLLWPKGAMESAAPSEYGVEQPRPDQSFLDERT